MKKKLLLSLIVLLNLFGIAGAQTDLLPPGVVINHMSKSTGKFIGSPAICVLPNGDYVVSHDEFGPGSTEFKSAVTYVFSSTDKGNTWNKIAGLDGQFWSNLFVHNGVLYIMGTNKHHGNVVIRSSTDGGKIWSIPYNANHGLILEGEYHTAPVPVLIHNGRIWRAVEYATAKSTRWGERYSAAILSAPVKSNLMNAESWTRSNVLPYDSTYLDGNFKAWLEGNVVATKEGKIINMLRVHTPKLKEEYSALVEVDSKGKKIQFDTDNFFRMPGASKKFTIRYDKKSDKYYSLVNYVKEEFSLIQTDRVRNTVALIASENLKKWDVISLVLEHPEPGYHAFQYIDWLFEGNDIIFVSRTAFDDEEGGAKAAHDANFLTFHRIQDFRKNSNY